MKLLHTSDWHVGKVLKGQSRTAEHVAVLAQVVDIARTERPAQVLEPDSGTKRSLHDERAAQVVDFTSPSRGSSEAEQLIRNQ